MIKTAYIDFDGTIIDVMRRYYNVLNDYLVENYDSFIRYEDYYINKRSGIFDTEIVLKEMEIEINQHHYNKYKADRLERISYLMYDKVIGCPYEAYEILKELDYRVIILTQRRSEENFLKQIEWLKLARCFDDYKVVSPRKGVNVKLDYLYEKVNSEDLLIGDGDYEMECARILQLRGYRVNSGLKRYDDLDVYETYNEVVQKAILTLKYS